MMQNPTDNAPSDDAQTDSDKREKFGTRFLTDPQNVFQHNAWDNVVWDEEQETKARQITDKQSKCLASEESRDQFEREADQFWDKFYGQHQNRFFKDRHWLFTEFPELYGSNKRPPMPSGAASHPPTSGETEEENKVCERETLEQTEKPNSGIEKAGDEMQKPNTSDESPPVDVQPNSKNVLSDIDEKTVEEVEGKDETKSFHMLEVGCGVGNTVFPVLQTNNNPNLMVYCCDFSSTAIDIVKTHPDYDPQRCCAFVHDITDESAVVPFSPDSLDVIIMIFVLSAVNPDKMQDAVTRLASYLKPGGIMLFRDYGRYDLAQLRFKEGRCITENFYARGDGTRVYFFTQDELREMFTKAGLEEKENQVDRRLQVNRGRQLKMYRVWIQCKYTKPAH